MILHSQKSGQFNYYLSATFLKKKSNNSGLIIDNQKKMWVDTV